jgi:uncharacterized membrane protein YbjE (DUF340 family)
MIDYSIPALLFPAITLLLLAYTNRFLAIATLIRSLKQQQVEKPNLQRVKPQIKNLKRRLELIKNMQIFGILSFFVSVITMILIYQEHNELANYAFGLSLFLLLFSLGISLYETQISTRALNLELKGLEMES